MEYLILAIDALRETCGDCEFRGLRAGRGEVYCEMFGDSLEVDDAADDAPTTYRRCAGCLLAGQAYRAHREREETLADQVAELHNVVAMVCTAPVPPPTALAPEDELRQRERELVEQVWVETVLQAAPTDQHVWERYVQGLLPQREIDDLVRGWAFAPLDVELARYERMGARSIAHGKLSQSTVDCAGYLSDRHIEYTALDPQAGPGLSVAGFGAYQGALQRVDRMVREERACGRWEVIPRVHQARCVLCEAQRTRESVLVRLHLPSGRVLSREYQAADKGGR